MASISVVVPTFNRASLISETLDAILRQTTSPDEIIVVDDGSTDNTSAALLRYAGKLVVIRNSNSGELVSRNTGLRAAKGDLVAFCDSDDLWEQDFLLEMSALWRSAPGLTAAYSNFRELQDGHLAARTKFDDAPEGFWDSARQVGLVSYVFDVPIAVRLLAFQPFFPSCMMVDRAAFQALGGWDEAVSRVVGCDFATTLRVTNAPAIGAVQKPLVRIRKHASNFSANVEAMNLGDARVLQHVIQSRPELHGFASAFQASIVERRQQALDSAFSRRDFGAVRDIDRLIPGHMRSRRQRVKAGIALLPPSLARMVAQAVSR